MPYHPSCARKSGTLPKRAVKKCCDFNFKINQLWKITIIPTIDGKIGKKIDATKHQLDEKIEEKIYFT